MTSKRIPILSLALLCGAIGSQAQFGPEQTIPQEGPRGVEILDMDQDGDNDVLISSRSGLQVLVNTDGAGNLSVPLMVAAMEAVGHAADVNGDGLVDVIGSSSIAGGINWYEAMGTYGYSSGINIDPAANATMIATGDVDGDGDLDLVMALENNTIQWSENTNGSGAFGPLQLLAYSSDVVELRAFDLNGDGDIDVSWGTATTDQEFWADNTDGLGGFSTPLLLSSAGRGIQVDIDGDGRRDLALVNNSNAQAIWQRATLLSATYGITRSIDLAVSDPGTILAADLDGDGDNDIVLTSLTTDEVLWYENIDGQGHFGPQQVISWDVEESKFLAAGDLDGDGDMELFAGSGPQQRVVRFDNLTNADGMITGRVFDDIDGDGLFDGSDFGIYNLRVELPGIGHTFTNHSGMYWFSVAPGTYTVQVPPVNAWSFSSPAAISTTVPATGGSQHNDFALNAATTIHHLDAQLTNAPMRCGRAIPYWVVVKNTGNQVDDLHLSLDLEDLSGFVSSDPAPVTNAAGVQTWDFDAVQPSHQRLITFTVQLPDASHMGEIMHDALIAQGWHGGAMVYTDTTNSDPVLNCAFDPNDKQVSPEGEGDVKLTAMDATLTYTIRFQSTGTIAAEDVVIQDQLDADLDPSSVQLIGASHPVHVLAGADGLVTFTFAGIMLPDSGSDMQGSQGYVRFTAHALSGLPDMTPVHNQAEIIFDANPAITTNTTFNTLTYGMTGVQEPLVIGDAFITVQPNPAFDVATIHIGSGLTGRVTIDVYDETGQQMIRLIRNTNTIIIHREDMPQGVYLLRATDEFGREAITRLVWGR